MRAVTLVCFVALLAFSLVPNTALAAGIAPEQRMADGAAAFNQGKLEAALADWLEAAKSYRKQGLPSATRRYPSASNWFIDKGSVTNA